MSYQTNHQKVTYFKRFWRGFDRFGAAVIYNIEDVTISSLCWVVLNADTNITAKKALVTLRLAPWQHATLKWIGHGLEFFWPGHCEGARISDIGVSENIQELLCPPK